MKKLIKVLATLVACIVTCSSMVACTGTSGGGGVAGIKLDPNKQTIILNVFGGGFGTKWAIDVCNAWNQSEEGQASEYQFTLKDSVGHQTSVSGFANEFGSNIFNADIYFCDDCDMTEMKRQAGKLLDLSDVWSASPDANGKTIRDKFFFGNEVESIFSIGEGSGAKRIALPYTMGTSGIVYDIELFDAMKWYIKDTETANGLSVGMDGVEGTYDDGLPTNEEEFQALLTKIKNNKMTPFIVYGTIDSAGTAHVINAINAQYEGVESYVNGYDYKGEIYRNGEMIEVTPQTGYKVYENLEGRAKGVQFVEDYIIARNADKTYKYLDSRSDDSSHKESESYYVYSRTRGTRIAMTINGAWWENEARSAFDTDKRRGNPGYGEREFGFMPVPVLDGQNPDSNKAVYSVNQFGSVFAVKSSDEGKNQAIKQFLTYYASNDGLNKFTKAVGVAPGFKFDIDMSEGGVYDGLTRFGQIYYEICNSEHTEIVAPTVFKFLSPLNYGSTSSPNRNAKVGDTYKTPFQAMNRGELAKRLTAAQIIETWNNEWNSEKWSTLVDSVTNAGYTL